MNILQPQLRSVASASARSPAGDLKHIARGRRAPARGVPPRRQASPLGGWKARLFACRSLGEIVDLGASHGAETYCTFACWSARTSDSRPGVAGWPARARGSIQEPDRHGRERGLRGCAIVWVRDKLDVRVLHQKRCALQCAGRLADEDQSSAIRHENARATYRRDLAPVARALRDSNSRPSVP